MHFPVLIARLLWQLAPAAPSPHAWPGVGWPIRPRSWRFALHNRRALAGGAVHIELTAPEPVVLGRGAADAAILRLGDPAVAASPSACYCRIPVNISPIMAACPVPWPTAVSDSSTGFP